MGIASAAEIAVAKTGKIEAGIRATRNEASVVLNRCGDCRHRGLRRRPLWRAAPGGRQLTASAWMYLQTSHGYLCDRRLRGNQWSVLPFRNRSS